MVAYNFQKQFAPKIRSREKPHTIRANRKRHARPGEAVQLYTGMRTKYCEKLLDPDPICISVERIRILQVQSQPHVIVGQHSLIPSELKQLAIADGFDDVESFIDFFESTHGLPFEGVLIKWK